MKDTSHKCPYCDGTNVTLTEIIWQFPYGIMGDVILEARCQRPCAKMQEMWLPWEAEEPMNRAIQEYRAGNRKGTTMKVECLVDVASRGTTHR